MDGFRRWLFILCLVISAPLLLAGVIIAVVVWSIVVYGKALVAGVGLMLRRRGLQRTVRTAFDAPHFLDQPMNSTSRRQKAR